MAIKLRDSNPQFDVAYAGQVSRPVRLHLGFVAYPLTHQVVEERCGRDGQSLGGGEPWPGEEPWQAGPRESDGKAPIWIPNNIEPE